MELTMKTADKPKVLIIGAGDFQLPLVERAAQRCEVYIAAPVVSQAFLAYAADTCLCDVRDKETILAFAKEKGIDGVLTDQTDIPVCTVAYVAEKMGLPGIGYEAGLLFTDKSRMRDRMEELGIKLLPHKTVFSGEEAAAFFEEVGEDVILKPLDTQGSRGVTACKSKDEVIAAFPEASKWSQNGGVIVEKQAKGREFLVEGMACGGRFKNLCIGDTYYFTLPGVFAAQKRIFPSDAPEGLQERVLDLNTKIIEGFGLKQGLTHSEFIMDGDDIYLLETAARGGGVFISSDLIALSTGLDPEDFLIGLALGEIGGFPAVERQKCCCGYRAFYIPSGTVEKTEGIEEVKSLPYIHRHQLDKLRVGMTVNETHRDKTSRLAIIISAPDRKTWEEREKTVRELLKAEVRTSEGVRGLIWE